MNATSLQVYSKHPLAPSKGQVNKTSLRSCLWMNCSLGVWSSAYNTLSDALSISKAHPARIPKQCWNLLSSTLSTSTKCHSYAQS